MKGKWSGQDKNRSEEEKGKRKDHMPFSSEDLRNWPLQMRGKEVLVIYIFKNRTKENVRTKEERNGKEKKIRKEQKKNRTRRTRRTRRKEKTGKWKYSKTCISFIMLRTISWRFYILWWLYSSWLAIRKIIIVGSAANACGNIRRCKTIQYIPRMSMPSFAAVAGAIRSNPKLKHKFSVANRYVYQIFHTAYRFFAKVAWFISFCHVIKVKLRWIEVNWGELRWIEVSAKECCVSLNFATLATNCCELHGPEPAPFSPGLFWFC